MSSSGISKNDLSTRVSKLPPSQRRAAKFYQDYLNKSLKLQLLVPSQDRAAFYDYHTRVLWPPETTWDDAFKDLAIWYRKGIEEAKELYFKRYPNYSAKSWDLRKKDVFERPNSQSRVGVKLWPKPAWFPKKEITKAPPNYVGKSIKAKMSRDAKFGGMKWQQVFTSYQAWKAFKPFYTFLSKSNKA